MVPMTPMAYRHDLVPEKLGFLGANVIRPRGGSREAFPPTPEGGRPWGPLSLSSLEGIRPGSGLARPGSAISMLSLRQRAHAVRIL